MSRPLSAVGGMGQSGRMGPVLRFDHVGITVSDLGPAIAFFESLGLVLDGPSMAMEGEFLDTVIGMSGARTEIVMLRPPEGGTAIELSSFVRPAPEPGSPDAMAHVLGLRSVAFEVDDLDGAVARAAAGGYGVVGGLGEYEGVWRMAYVRGPDGIIVALAQRLG